MGSISRITAYVALTAVALAALSTLVASPVEAASATAAVTGRAYSEKGAPIQGLIVSAGSTSVKTNRAGKFALSGLAPGTYTLKFSDSKRLRYLTEYLGDAATAASADTITLTAGEKRTGVTERLAHAALISGVVRVNGEAADPDLGALTVRLTDAAGVTVADKSLTGSAFSIPGLPAGKYTLTATQSYASYPVSMPASEKVTVTTGQHLTGQRLELQLVRGVVQNSVVAASVTQVGTKVTISVRVNSYVSVSGGVVTLKYRRGLHESATIGTGGRASITISTATWKRGDRAQVNVLFDGPMGVGSSKAVTHFIVR